MIDSAALVKDLRDETRALEADLRGHTGGTPPEALAVSQAASAWVVATLLIRFCEDNQLTDAPFLAGPEGRLALARDRQQVYFLRHPERSDREWIEAALDSLSTSAATLRLFDDLHALMRQYPLSPYAASHLIGFWRRVDDAGQLIHDFSDPWLDTGFLGDVYQDLSELDRKTYALVQTPSFVADLILDRTVRPAMDSFGLRGLRIIDPVCGSGTFLLGAFRRLLEGWRQAEPDAVPWDQIRRALTSVHGVDRYPIAVVISRFRLLMAAIRAAGAQRLSEVPELPLTIARGDSLLRGGEKAAGTLANEPEWDLDDQAFPAADLLGTRELRRCRGQSAVHHGQGPGRLPALPVPLLGLPRQVPADRSVHRTILRTRAARRRSRGIRWPARVQLVHEAGLRTPADRGFPFGDRPYPRA